MDDKCERCGIETDDLYLSGRRTLDDEDELVCEACLNEILRME